MDTDKSTDAADSAATEQEEQPWWKDPSLPWEHKPTKSDLWCWALFAIYGIWGLVMLPLRPLLLKYPVWSVAINGSRLGMTSVGALASVDSGFRDWLIPLLLLGALSSMKWSPVFWWAGKLWGQTMIDVMTAQRPRWRVVAHRVEKFAGRHPFIALGLGYLVPQINVFVYITLGAAGMPLSWFLFYQLLWSLLSAGTVGALGYWIGAPAVHWLRLYSDIAFYVALAMLVVMFFLIWRRSRAATAEQN